MWVGIEVNSWVYLKLQSNHIDWLHKKVPVNFKLVSEVPYGWLNIEIWFFHFSSIYCYLQSFCWAVTWCGWCNWNCIRITWGQRCNSNTECRKRGTESCYAIPSAWGWQGWAPAPDLAFLQLQVIFPKDNQILTYTSQLSVRAVRSEVSHELSALNPLKT